MPYAGPQRTQEPPEEPNGPLCQIGICPFCHSDEVQTLLFADFDLAVPIKDGGRLVGYEQSGVVSLFRCQGCDRHLLFSTWTGLPGVWTEDDEDPNWIVKIPRDEFLQDSTLLFPLQNEAPSINLDPATPASVKKCLEIGVQVRSISRDLYALQLRKALEGVCSDLGASEYLPNGRRAMLWQQIDELGIQNKVGEFICKAAHELKELGNAGAHFSERQVDESDVRKLEHLLAIITVYVYGHQKQML